MVKYGSVIKDNISVIINPLGTVHICTTRNHAVEEVLSLKDTQRLMELRDAINEFFEGAT